MPFRTIDLWDRRYGRAGRGGPGSNYDAWLGRWQALLQSRIGRALDLGCGEGFDTEVLLRWGFEVTALDTSAAAIALARERNPEAAHRVMDLRHLHLLPRGFRVVVASLSLHYFGREETKGIFREVHSLLEPGGIFAFRVNAFDDVESGAPPDAASWELVSVEGIPKQFFTVEKLAEVLGSLWRVVALEKLTARRYGRRKSVYEVVAVKPEEPAPPFREPRREKT